ncbi:MAG: DUF3520 domain-containing protein, partial [Saprospiraceae bacterium]|nr:DUF3520 domain-containing protein [Saprospiraceae bacterium]
LDNLEAGGSTNGAGGLKAAYELASEHFAYNGNNRIVLATDGDFNVGIRNEGDLLRFIEEKRKSQIFLSVLGFGTGNYQDGKMQKLAEHGNGHHAYIDNLLEAKKVLVNEMGATLHTIAKDCKIQVEFNPDIVQQYRLVGYESRLLASEDFNNDQKDAGEIGAGHSVTALYEVVLAEGERASKDHLRYQKLKNHEEPLEDELALVKVRHKDPRESNSKEIRRIVYKEAMGSITENFKWSAAVAGFGMMLKESKYRGDADHELLADLARKGLGEDANGYRREFMNLMELHALRSD